MAFAANNLYGTMVHEIKHFNVQEWIINCCMCVCACVHMSDAPYKVGKFFTSW